MTPPDDREGAMTVPMKPEYGPTLGQLLAPRWHAASGGGARRR